MPTKPHCTPVAALCALPAKDVHSLHYDMVHLQINMWGDGETDRITLTFPHVVGFRVLDERNLLSYWNEYSQPNGWIYEVHSGGWKDEDAQRDDYHCSADESHALNNPLRLREYFVVGDKCVSVLTYSPPTAQSSKPPFEIVRAS